MGKIYRDNKTEPSVLYSEAESSAVDFVAEETTTDKPSEDRSDAPCESYLFDLTENSVYEGSQKNEEMGDYQIHFSGNVSNFSSVLIGKGKGTYSGQYLSLTKDKLQIFDAKNDTVHSEYDLDLVITDYLEVNINADLEDHARIKIVTDESYKVIKCPWQGRMGSIFVQTDENTSLLNCRLTYTANGWEKPIWLMGDSYFNCSSTKRWTYYLLKDGAENILLNGYPGRKSEAALVSLKTMLEYATPEEIIWCMGMNDKDTENEVNAKWKKVLDELIGICEEKNIELVLATIPNCPMRNNIYKNRIVRESGYRYIDFSKAVGADENTEWSDGLLEASSTPKNRVHPTKQGAVALYRKAVEDCPELF